MHRFVFAALVLLTLSACSQTDFSEEPVWLFYTGEDYLQIDAATPEFFARKEMYLSGLNDALNVFATARPGNRWIADCSLERDAAQLRMMFDMWLNVHPERVAEPAPRLYRDALHEACQQQLSLAALGLRTQKIN